MCIRDRFTIATGLCLVLILYIYIVSTADICPVSAADICPVSTADICPVSTEDIEAQNCGDLRSEENLGGANSIRGGAPSTTLHLTMSF